MSAGRPLGIGVIGLGFMGRTHVRAYAKAASGGLPCRLVAVCDQDPVRRTGSAPPSGNLGAEASDSPAFDPQDVRCCAEPQDLLNDDSVDAVSICTHTPSHLPLALAALAAGKHVLVEKPVALSSAEVRRLADHARQSRRIVMPAMCMRFWPGWTWLKEQVASGAFGPVRSAVFRRLASPPAWAPEFYEDARKTGGALFDLHLHDVDFIRWCFGGPERVSSTGDVHHLTTLYAYPAGPPHVVAEGGWRHAPSFGFRMTYVIRFDELTAEYDSSRRPPLLLYAAGRCDAAPLIEETGYEAEVRHFVSCIVGGRPTDSTLEDAISATTLLEAERESLHTGMPAGVTP